MTEPREDAAWRRHRQSVMECPTRGCGYRTSIGTVYQAQRDLDRHRAEKHDLPALNPRSR